MLASVYMRKNDAKNTKEILNNGISANPESTELHLVLANFYTITRQY